MQRGRIRGAAATPHSWSPARLRSLPGPNFWRGRRQGANSPTTPDSADGEILMDIEIVGPSLPAPGSLSISCSLRGSLGETHVAFPPCFIFSACRAQFALGRGQQNSGIVDF